MLESSQGGFAFGSGGASQGDTKPVFAFGTWNQTSNLSSGFPFTFGSLKQGGSVCEQQTEDTQKVFLHYMNKPLIKKLINPKMTKKAKEC